jgi:hypothetical protein
MKTRLHLLLTLTMLVVVACGNLRPASTPTLRPPDSPTPVPPTASRTSRPPTSTPTATATATLAPRTPEQFIRYYFECLNARNYELAWSLLSGRFIDANNGESQGGYQGYVAYWDAVRGVQIQQVNISRQDNSNASLAVSLELHYNDGTVTSPTLNFILTYDPLRQTWQLDTAPIPTPGPSPTSTSEVFIIWHGDVDFGGSLGSVKIVLSRVFGTMDGRVDIYRNTAGRPLLYTGYASSEPGYGYVQTAFVSGHPLILVVWAENVDFNTAYPLLWDGSAFHEPPAFDQDGQQLDIIGIQFDISANGTITATNGDGVEVWSLAADGYHLTKDTMNR